MYNVISMTARRSHHTYLHYAAFILFGISVFIAGYYCMNSPTYQSSPADSAEPAVRGVSIDTSPQRAPLQEKLIVHIPDGIYVALTDREGRMSGYTPDVNGFKNEIPYSDVIISAEGDKSIEIVRNIGPKYTVEIDGEPQKESLLIELENAEATVESELIPLDSLSKAGISAILTVHPFIVESLDTPLYVQ